MSSRKFGFQIFQLKVVIKISQGNIGGNYQYFFHLIPCEAAKTNAITEQQQRPVLATKHHNSECQALRFKVISDIIIISSCVRSQHPLMNMAIISWADISPYLLGQ